MCEFDHPNILKLSGVCLDGGPAPYIIMPFMANGSLLGFLKEERENLVLDPISVDGDGVVSSVRDSPSHVIATAAVLYRNFY